MRFIASLILVLVLSGCMTQRGFPPEHQIVNFDRVDDHTYRGAQPTLNGLQYLHSIGVKSVVCLRMANDVMPAEQDTSEQLGMTFTSLPLSGVSTPTLEEMNRYLDIIESLPGPVFIHCQYGCDRTGTIIACLRIRHGWDNQRALTEAKFYGISPLLPNLQAFILGYRIK